MNGLFHFGTFLCRHSLYPEHIFLALCGRIRYCLKRGGTSLYCNCLTSCLPTTTARAWKRFCSLTRRLSECCERSSGLLILILGWFVCLQDNSEEEGVWYDCGAPFYADQTNEWRKSKTYGEGVMRVTTDMFLKGANELPERVSDNHGMEHKVGIIQALFCDVRYIKDTRYQLENSILKAERLKEPKESNAQHLQSRSPPSSQDLSSFKILGI